jgi:predicted nucleic acid-binding protein
MTPYRQIYLDTNIFVMFKETKSREGFLLDLLFKFSASRRSSFVTSALTFSELLVKPYRERDQDLIQTYSAWSRSTAWLTITPVSTDVLDVAALLRAERGRLKLPDAIHLATAIGMECSHFLTADMGLETVDNVVHPVLGDVGAVPLSILRPDEPTLTSLLQSLAE